MTLFMYEEDYKNKDGDRDYGIIFWIKFTWFKFKFWKKDSDKVENLVVVAPKPCVVNLFERKYFFNNGFVHAAKLQK